MYIKSFAAPPPPPGAARINFDGAVFKDERNAGIRVVIYDNKGLGAKMGFYPFLINFPAKCFMRKTN